jgi:hypothetical protein
MRKPNLNDKSISTDNEVIIKNPGNKIKISKGYFTDKNIKPTDKDINYLIGSGKNNWDLLTNYLIQELKLKGEFKFYGVNYGWALGFNKSGKSVIALYPDKDCFTIQIILNKNQVDSSLIEVKNQKLLELIQRTKSIHEGKWIYVMVDNKTDLKDIYILLNIRIKVK